MPLGHEKLVSISSARRQQATKGSILAAVALAVFRVRLRAIKTGDLPASSQLRRTRGEPGGVEKGGALDTGVEGPCARLGCSDVGSEYG